MQQSGGVSAPPLFVGGAERLGAAPALPVCRERLKPGEAEYGDGAGQEWGAPVRCVWGDPEGASGGRTAGATYCRVVWSGVGSRQTCGVSVAFGGVRRLAAAATMARVRKKKVPQVAAGRILRNVRYQCVCVGGIRPCLRCPGRIRICVCRAPSASRGPDRGTCAGRIRPVW